MLPEYWAIIGAIIASVGGLYYLYETITGKSRPNRITWLLWGIFPMVTFLAQKAQGVEGLAWASFVSGFIPLLVFIASFFNRKAYWKSRSLDYACMVVGVLGLGLWAVTDNANLAILFVIFADLAAAVPTIIKAKRQPESESWIAYAISTAGFALALLSIQVWNFESYAFVTYLLIVNGLLAILAARKMPTDPLGIEPA